VSLGFFEENILERPENMPHEWFLYRENYPGCNKNKLKIIITREKNPQQIAGLNSVQHGFWAASDYF
jgi:hypothetical protein